ncbi:MAG: hypothetical protein GF317_11955 [Candidatus Lokiarchaeota archaeon]|nr:hypothetical protein [Candidatus Lokiarchaeota archaeon]
MIMKIVVFAPHPDDELIGAGGSILKWMEEGHNIHIIYVSDGRAAYTYEKKMGRLILTEQTQISEDELAGIRMREINEVIKFLEIPLENISKFELPDQQVSEYIDLGVEKSKEIIKDADRLVIPSNNNPHTDHQATFTIATKAAKELELSDIEFYVYSIYVSVKAPKEKRVKVDTANYREKVYRALLLYDSQKYISSVKSSFKNKKRSRRERFGVFKLEDLNDYYNF